MNRKPKMNVMKSKSSNSALVIKNDRKIKKSRANAKFQESDVNKRGVYVENKTTKSLDIHETDVSQTGKRTAPPPRPGKKRFLASVLSILSKDTTITQRPTETQLTDVKKDKKRNTKVPDTNEDTFEAEGTITEKISRTEVEEFKRRVQDKKKKKYRSKILNEYITADKFEVLQRNRMSDSPSVGSDFDREEINWMGFPKLVIPDQNDEETEGREVSDLVKQISEGRKPKEKASEKEPSTLVAENKDDNKLYNFFVDILETTFNVYNVKTESSNASAASSNVALEIDETVAKKLRFKNIENQETQEPSKPYYTITDAAAHDKGNLPDIFETKPTGRRENRDLRSNSPPKKRGTRSSSPQKKRLGSESFNSPKNKMPPPISRSDVISQRSSLYKRNKKRDLINLLREQLKMDDNYYDEPQNLYDALKVIARNKRKCQKTLRIPQNKKTEDLRDECMLKRRKIVTANSSFKYPKHVSTRPSDMTRHRQKPVNEVSTDYEPSNYSIEVYGFDYDSPKKKKMSPKLKNYLFTYHSSESDFGNGICSRSELITN